MPTRMDDIVAKMPAGRREKIEKRAAELSSEHVEHMERMSLQALRKAKGLTQAELAGKMHVTQDAISRLEKRNDFLFSTMEKAVTSLGGSIAIIATFPDLGVLTIAPNGQLVERKKAGKAPLRSVSSKKREPVRA